MFALCAIKHSLKRNI
ncbi:unnamed protein product [Larinioides sclopetarius]|uniref:Uncharacterized protein n=1 Tax=Larinioides sclopetarius TaxID=280406 RepID=A0AAV2B126_9ARAC